jgi:hypothetical protein
MFCTGYATAMSLEQLKREVASLGENPASTGDFSE